MAIDGITTRLQKEMGQLQHELSQLQVDIDAKFDTRLKEFQERFKGDMRSELYSILEQFLDQHSIGALLQEGLHQLTWELYPYGFQTLFGSNIYQDPMEKLVSLKQQGTMDQIHDCFGAQLLIILNFQLNLFHNLTWTIGGNRVCVFGVLLSTHQVTIATRLSSIN
ncbi:hypothetical protein PVK06_035710 [Gossypium arboreum]|uniref:Uncharacterized protein n=1 Tax=Gossypium arboreum TaxID=29729 RepID=A0ABR0NIP1_GOSAR|nr:hypothetical protein PVK06_035710 [Gossypium arboreum]